MKQFYLLLFFSTFLSSALFAQEDSVEVKKDSLPKKSFIQKTDTLKTTNTLRVADTLQVKSDSLFNDSLRLVQASDSLKRAAVKKSTPAETHKEGEQKFFSGKEYLFYYLIFLLLLFGLLRLAFAKYFSDLFRVFFKTTLKLRQVREQLLQSPLPSVMMNGFFVLVTGLYINFLLQHFNLSVSDNFWLQYLYCAGGLSAIYVGKYICLRITGWLFNAYDAADSYIFIVFIINKMLGVVLLPVLLFLAFSTEPLYGLVLFISWILAALLLIYRFILSYGALRNEVKLNSFHFILYIIGFEIIPLLLIYKLLLIIF
jgi:hypothetical protein